MKYYPRKVRIFTGTFDPLRDDCLRFNQYLSRANIDCKTIEFKYFPHGFLNYDMPGVAPEVAEVYDYILLQMEEVITS